MNKHRVEEALRALLLAVRAGIDRHPECGPDCEPCPWLEIDAALTAYLETR